jgi:hypothetical protein
MCEVALGCRDSKSARKWVSARRGATVIFPFLFAAI